MDAEDLWPIFPVLVMMAAYYTGGWVLMGLVWVLMVLGFRALTR